MLYIPDTDSVVKSYICLLKNLQLNTVDKDIFEYFQNILSISRGCINYVIKQALPKYKTLFTGKCCLKYACISQFEGQQVLSLQFPFRTRVCFILWHVLCPSVNIVHEVRNFGSDICFQKVFIYDTKLHVSGEIRNHKLHVKSSKTLINITFALFIIRLYLYFQCHVRRTYKKLLSYHKYYSMQTGCQSTTSKQITGQRP